MTAAFEDTVTASEPPIVWQHDRSDNDVISYRMGRQGTLVVAEWPGVARLTCAPDGTRVRVTPDPTAPPGSVEKLRGVIKVMIGELAGGLGLHGAAVALGSQAVLLLGKSGAGKSTAAATLCARHGGQLLADDAALLEQRADVIEVAPSQTEHYLTRASGAVAGVRFHDAGPEGERKALVQAATCAERGYPVVLVVCLEVEEAGSGHPCRQLTGAEAVARVLGSMFRFNPPDHSARRRELDRVLRLYAQAPFIEVRRTRARPDAVPDILSALQGGARVR